MEQPKAILKDFSEQEKGAYLGAIASLATADHKASEEELQYIMALAEAAEMTEQQKQAVVQAATELTGEELTKCLDILKNSQLKFSLITDLISFAQSDNHYAAEEKSNIRKISKYLGINDQQFGFLDQFVQQSSAPQASANNDTSGFLSSSGLGESMKNAGIDLGSLGKGFLGMIGPMVLAGLVSRGMRGSRSGGGFGGMGGMMGGGMMGGGGLGSLISILSGGRGYRKTGGLLGRFLGF